MKQIEEAVRDKKRIAIRYLDLDFDIIVDPYIIGDDFFQLRFVWGWIEFNRTCYKFFEKDIISVRILEENFNVQKGMEYYFAMEETLYHFAEDFPFYVTFKGEKSEDK